VDHDEETNKVRGLLCRHCNQGIGLLRHSQDNLRRAVAYLEKHHPTKTVVQFRRRV
jgi:hypothetical protein